MVSHQPTVKRRNRKTLIVMLAILFPPAAVLMQRGLGSEFAINVLLTLLFFVPGILHAMFTVISGFRGPGKPHRMLRQPNL